MLDGQRLFGEACSDCGAKPGEPCRVAFGRGPNHAKSELILDWAHTQRK